MTRILVGLDGSLRGEKALAWAADRAARTDASLTLLTVIDPEAARATGATAEMLSVAVNNTLRNAQDALMKEHPGMEVNIAAVQGRIIDSIVEASSGHDMIVLGSHHGASVGEALGGAKGLRVSVSVPVPTVVVPVDWNPEDQGEGVVVGVGPDKVSDAAVMFGVKEAVAQEQELKLISAWGLPPYLTKPAEAMGGGIDPVGKQFQEDLDLRASVLRVANPEITITAKAVEGPVPARVISEEAVNSKLLVLGTHSRTVMGRALFGSVTHGVLLHLHVPTVIVPQA